MKSLDMLGKALGSDQALIVYWTILSHEEAVALATSGSQNVPRGLVAADTGAL